MSNNSKQSVFLRGITGSKGACVAQTYVFKKRIEVKKTPITPDEIDKELERLDAAIRLTHNDIVNSRKNAEEKHGEKYAAIFDSHLLMLEDPQFRPRLEQRLRSEMVNVESVVRARIDEIQAAFSAIADPYLRERAIDIKDVGDQLLRHLMGLEGPAAEIGAEPYVLVAAEVTPSEILEFARGNLQGVCLDSGGATSHVAILSGALGIPSVFGLTNLSQVARTGEPILIDTRSECRVVINPDPDEISALRRSLKNEKKFARINNCTADGFCVHVGVNIARSEELPLLKKLEVQRIGLFRSEFMFMESMDLPSEKFQREVYGRVVKAAPELAVLRTVDIGSDKPLKYLPLSHEENPAMGFRSIRFSLSRPDILETQLRAMMHAAKHGNVRIIFPMVSVAEELAQIDALYRRVAAAAKIDEPPEWGIMLEVPSAAFMLDAIADYTSYISLGTNDLLQFFYAIDRTNEKLAGLAGHMSQPFLRLIYKLVKRAEELGIKVGVCGEMASDPAGFVALLGAGVGEVSIRPAAAAKISAMIPQLERGRLMKFMPELVLEQKNADVRKEILNEFPNLTEFFT